MALRKKTPRTLCVTSGKGGVGKTSFTVNFAIALARNGSRVLVVDGDMGLANVDVLLRLSVKSNIQDILESGADPRQALIFARPNLAVLPGSSGVPEMVSLGEKQQDLLAGFIKNVSSDFDYVIIDTAAGIGSSVLWYNRFCDQNIFIMSPDPTSMTDAYALMKLLSRDHGINRFNIVLNFVRGVREGNHTVATISSLLVGLLRAICQNSTWRLLMAGTSFIWMHLRPVCLRNCASRAAIWYSTIGLGALGSPRL